MNWDHPIHSFTDPNAEPQTPTRTPTTAAFGDPFQTPKLESSFYDPRVTWNTADPYGSSPDFPKTPQRFHHGHARRPSETEPSLGGTPAGFAQQHQFSPVLERRSNPVDLSQNITASVNDGDFLAQQHGWLDGEDGSLTKRSAASMQTPPPTSSSRRKLQTSTKTSSTPYDARTPRQQGDPSNHQETPSRIIGLSPDLFGVQGSPGLFQLPGGSATTASPFFSQQQMPWDQEPDLPPSGPLGISNSYGDTYALSGQASEGFDNFGSLGNPNLQAPQHQAPQNPLTFDQHPTSSASYLDVDNGAALATSFFTSPRAPPTQNEDPSMFLSSPARRFGFQESEMSPMAPRLETRKPYHFQTEESERDKREKELRKLERVRSAGRRQQKSFLDDTSTSRAQTVAARSTKRPSINTAVPPSLSHTRNLSQPSPAGAGVKKSPSKGRSSPIKAHRPALSRPPSATAAAPMESVVLKIGKDGRAKTEMITQSPVKSGLPDLQAELDEGSSTESESDFSDNNDNPVTSFSQNNTSFNVPEISPLKPSIARSSSRSRPHSKSSSYSSTVASSHSGRHSPWAGSSRGSGRRVDAMQREGWANQRRHSTNPLVGSSRAPSSTDSDATQEEAYYNENDESGDAQHALMQVLKQRSRPPTARKQASYRAVGRTIHPATTLPSSPPVYRGHQEIRPKGTSSPAQPTDRHVTPKPGRHSNPISGTRCVCNSKDNGGHLMIQCESCTHWLHTKCVGLDRQSLPAVYVCIYCTHTPRRGGHAREPVSAGGQASSPLARKSFQPR